MGDCLPPSVVVRPGPLIGSPIFEGPCPLLTDIEGDPVHRVGYLVRSMIYHGYCG